MIELKDCRTTVRDISSYTCFTNGFIFMGFYSFKIQTHLRQVISANTLIIT